VLLPLLLIGLATGAAAIMAYGTHPSLAQHARGLEIIMATRRLEWPLITLALVLSIALLVLVISGRRRAWWLIGLAPILALFVHRFAPFHGPKLFILDSPRFVTAEQMPAMRDDAWIVGVVFADQPYALPYSMLYSTPVVFITDYDRRLLLMWSARANPAIAFTISREFKSRDLQIVTTPADTLLLFDRRLGQFIVALTGQTAQGERPTGINQQVPTTKTTWSNWRKLHPGTKLLCGYESRGAPAAPIRTSNPEQLIDGAPAGTVVVMVHALPPLAVPTESAGNDALNVMSGLTPILLLRDPSTQRMRAFERRVQEDLFPRFAARTNRRLPDAALVDGDSNSLWTLSGKAIDGPLKGAQLRELIVEEDLYWGPMKRWYPTLTLSR
jgi:hypothetical protein